jgi:hypothetical protein
MATKERACEMTKHSVSNETQHNVDIGQEADWLCGIEAELRAHSAEHTQCVEKLNSENIP